MQDTRWAVLELIRTQPMATVASLADALHVAPITIRHHLATLQAEGLVTAESAREGVGRPKHVYKVTEAAQRYFPNKYHTLVEGLLDELKTRLPPEQVELIIDGMAANVAAKYNTARITGSLEDRLRYLVTILGEEGFMAQVNHIDGAIVLTELNCPYLYVGQRHPEVCRIDRALMQNVLGTEVEQTSCVLNGDTRCTFSVKEPVAGSALKPAS
jgi:predicted ArsR family transcriptional regulator